MSNPPTTPASGAKSGGRNCLLYGCLSMVALVVLGILTVYLVVRYTVNSYIEQFTATEPRQFEEATLPDDEMAALRQRIAGFQEAVKDTNAVATLSLDSRELNALLAANQDFAEFKDLVRLRLEDGAVSCDVSMPLSEFSKLPFLSRLDGRYLNADMDLSVSLSDGTLVTRLNGASVKNVALPEEVIAELQKSLPWEEVKQSPEAQELLDQLRWLKIEGDRLQLGTGEPPAGP